VSLECVILPDDIVTMDELVTFLGIQMLISYHRLPELDVLGTAAGLWKCTRNNSASDDA
jgi:hypothetical protein